MAGASRVLCQLAHEKMASGGLLSVCHSRGEVMKAMTEGRMIKEVVGQPWAALESIIPRSLALPKVDFGVGKYTRKF